MDKKLKTKWVKALRSGKFEQAQMSLKRPVGDGVYGYCCLGVLRHLINPKSKAEDKEIGDLLCKTHLRQSGLDYEIQNSLAQMNDGKGKYSGRPHTFAQIADYIEKTL